MSQHLSNDIRDRGTITHEDVLSQRVCVFLGVFLKHFKTLNRMCRNQFLLFFGKWSRFVINLPGNFHHSHFVKHGRNAKLDQAVSQEPAAIIAKILGTTAQDMLAYGRIADLGAKLSGQMGAQAHYANGLAALYIATGQDAACVAESAVGFTRMEARGDDLFCSVTMPNILVGSVGGGTGLASQSAGLNILGLKGAGHGAALAEVTAALCLCGEISIVAAIASGDFTRAHENLARLR